MSNKYFTRCINSERTLLMSMNGINYMLMQRDWDSISHGDLDIIIEGSHWERFVKNLLAVAKTNEWHIVKSYEIEHGVVSIVLLTLTGTLFLDVSIAPYKNNLYGVQIQECLVNKSEVNGIFVADTVAENTYSRVKRQHKNSMLNKILFKIKNSRIIAERICTNLAIIRGGILYIPYITDRDILMSQKVQTTAISNLMNILREKYAS